MSTFFLRLRRLSRYIKSFGVTRGVHNFLQVSKRAGLARLDLGRGLPPLFLRRSSSDLDVFDEVFIRKAYTTERLAGESPTVIVDAGANIGITSVYFAILYPQARIVSLEPEHSNFELLKRNTSSYARVRAVQAALCATDTTVEIEDPGHGYWSFRVREAGSHSIAPRVQAVSPSTLRARFGLDTIDIFKIDIEGGERDLFERGLRDVLDATRHIIIELHDRFLEGCSRAFYAAITDYMFIQEIKDKNVFVQLQRRGNDRMGFARTGTSC